MPSIAEGAALDVLADDGLVAFPTETVWGLAARAESAAAVGRLRAFKGREAEKALSLLVDSPERVGEVGVVWDEPARGLAAAFWPGPLTLVVSCASRFAPGVAGEDGSIGIRCSAHPVAASLARGAFGRGLGPVTATSLNKSGERPARSRSEAERICGEEIPMLAGESAGEAPSTVVDARTSCLRVLREGAVPRAAVEGR